ncbi:putative plus-end-directed kinesin ATPase [Helianthus annuus]|nr:putative plus-end-directed kinesin ATPase [Helianthus annuus]
MSISGDEMDPGDGQEEKIFVTVRVRPLNAKEIAKNDVSDWECVSNTTIIYKNVKALTERSMYPNAYTFDRVYGCDSTTRQVYEEGVKRIALSALNGFNSSVFAYGQTSSGKTYTMTGITQYAISDIFDHINQQDDREFVLKFSAIEIYNECVRDLLSADATPLRLLDDPEKGTIVDKLTEIHLEDWTHLMELLAVCEAQRKIGETSMNEMSSRSHQIIRLTIESSPSEVSGVGSASILAATVNFVDLAGSERASQTNSVGKRLKEGGHINRSLLTLGTVIRKLSKEPNGHIPYRDSKLTRILQNSLGGNAKTAIVCTLSPAHAHLEQSRNTLLFAVCAKEVRTSAQVNVVMSEKVLVKQLQQEMARLEHELKNMSGTTNDSEAIIKEKELQIQKMEQEIKELTQERDLARSRLDELLRAAGVDQNSLQWTDSSSWDGGSASVHLRGSSWDGGSASVHLRGSSWDGGSASGHLRGSSWDGHYTSDTSDVAVNVKVKVNAPLPPTASVNTYSFPKNHKLRNPNEDHYVFDNITPREFMNQYFGPDPTQEWDKTSQKARERTNSIDSCKEVEVCIEKDEADDVDDIHDQDQNQNQNEGDFGNSRVDKSPRSALEDVSETKTPSITRSSSCSAVIEGDVLSSSSHVSEKNVVVESKSESDIKKLCRQDSQRTITGVDEKEMQDTDGDIFISSPSSNTHEKVMVKATPETIESGDELEGFDSGKEWSLVFEDQRKKIIELWNECNIPLLHRTYFFLLIKGDPSDSVYIEVELRRLAFLKKTLDQVASARALNLERAMLSRKLLKKFTSAERREMFAKWGIDLESRNRRFQLSQLLWTKTDDIEHIRNSAEIVAKLVGLIEPDKTPKELFGLTVATKQESQSLLSTWRNSLSLLRY